MDMDEILARAEEGRGVWGSSAALPVLERIAKENELVLEWDGGACEEWMLMRRAGELQVVAGIELPLVFSLEGNQIDLPSSVSLVRIPSMMRPILRCSRSVLEAVFRRRFKAIDFYPAGFGVLDLVMATM